MNSDAILSYWSNPIHEGRMLDTIESLVTTNGHCEEIINNGLLISALQQKTNGKSEKWKCEWPAFSDNWPPPRWLQVDCLARGKKPWNRWNGEIQFNSICCCPVCFADPLRGRGEGGDNGKLAINLFLELSVCLSPSWGV